MSRTADAIHGLSAAWMLARFNPAGITLLDDTPEGAWRSLAALALVLPLAGLSLLFQISGDLPTGMLLLVILVELVSQVVTVAGYLVLVHAILAHLGQDQRFPRFMAAYNWAYALQVAFLIAVATFQKVTGLGKAGSDVVEMVAVFYVLAFRLFVARTALGVGLLGGVGLVLLNALVMILVNAMTLGMTGTPFPEPAVSG